LWFLTLLVGVGVCAFAFSGHQSMFRLVFLPLGVFLIGVSIYRMRRLSRRRGRDVPET
jgi:hypothetical protein